jgi:CheY-like chemotaxis protein
MKVFISSTFKDLVHHRAKVADAVERLGQQGVRMEVFGARPNEASVASLEELEAAEVFVGIYAHRYGEIPAGSSVSITRMEFDLAKKLGKPILSFVVDDDYPWPPKHVELEPGYSKLLALKHDIGCSLIRDTFTTAEDLAFKVAASLGRYLLQQKVRADLAQAAKGKAAIPAHTLDQVSRRAERMARIISGSRLLLVNDIPGEMATVIQLLQDLDVEVEVVTNSADALERLSAGSFDAVVTDMSRNGIPDEGLRFLEKMQKRRLYHPTVFTVGKYEPHRGTPAYAFGITNRVDDLLNYLFDILDRVRG